MSTTTRDIVFEISLPMDFPKDWDNDMIEFHLNESSWCADNLIHELEKYSEQHGCICGICRAYVEKNDDPAEDAFEMRMEKQDK